MKLSNPLYLLLSAIVAIVACLLLFASLNHGIGISPDSVAYIRAASEFRSGGGISSLPNHWPPLYPVVLSAVGVFGSDELFAIRVFHSILYAINIFLIPLLLVPKSDRQNLVRLIFSLFLLASPQFFKLHQMAWSEPLFLTFCFFGLALLFRGRSRNAIYLSACLLSLATLTRYVGVYFIMMGVIGVLFLSNGNALKRLRFAFTYGLIAIVPNLVYGITNSVIRGSSTNRSFNVHFATPEHLESLRRLFFGWFTPYASNLIGILLVSATVAVTIIYMLRLWPRKTDHSISDKRIAWPLFLLLTAFGYTLFILTSISFFDAYTPIDERVFIPCYLALWGTIFSIINSNSKWLSTTALSVAAIMLASNYLDTSKMVTQSINNGTGYLVRGSKELPILDAVEQTSPGTIIYSNAADFLYITRKIEARPLPKEYSPVSLKTSDDFTENLARIAGEMRGGNAIVVYVSGFSWRQYFPKPNSFIKASQLGPIYYENDGLILGSSKAKGVEDN